MASDPSFSQRASEVADDLFSVLDSELKASGLGRLSVRFRLDGTDSLLEREAAEVWIKQSVDAGYPAVRHFVESEGPLEVVVNLAAFEDPDYQYHP